MYSQEKNTNFSDFSDSSGSGQASTPASPQSGTVAKQALDAFAKNFMIAIPAVALFISEIVIGALLEITAMAIYGAPYSYLMIYSRFYAISSISAFLEGLLTGLFSAITIIEADAALSSQGFSFVAAVSTLKARLNPVLTFSIILAILDLLWVFTGYLGWLFDGLTNMVFLVIFLAVLTQPNTTVMNAISEAVKKVMGWINKDALSVLALFLAAIFLGFPVLELAAMPIAALIALIFYGGESQPPIQAQPPTAQQPSPQQPSPQGTTAKAL